MPPSPETTALYERIRSARCRVHLPFAVTPFVGRLGAPPELQRNADEIARNLDFLATTQHSLPVRHRSLHAAFEHSWTLLSRQERAAFARLAVFGGGLRPRGGPGRDDSAWPVLAALCEKALVRRDSTGRYGCTSCCESLPWGSYRQTGRRSAKRTRDTGATTWGCLARSRRP